ncbi:dockerin type I domain-containing protein [Stieleria varia]|uniref:Dockerin type I repeat protein n=1 Tax=Stieleria varia TaxID=2528005 RepID=A0A5C6B8U3_9BACT|nr:dockerin type I domain-containing protein [Stieleria varia]TWU08503.1 hypothetical protein Pla52n_10860 [Stieleria varia]
MSKSNLFANPFYSRKREIGRRKRKNARRFECLEPRLYLAAEVINVNVTADEVIAGDGRTSLREAIIRAHTSPEETVIINLQPGSNYGISRSLGGVEENSSLEDPLYGDFDITRDLVINGNGATIDANSLSRIFDIRAQPLGAPDVSLNDLTLTGGLETRAGGAIRISNTFSHGGGVVAINGSTILSNRVVASQMGQHGDDAYGGGIYSFGSYEIVLDDTVIESNSAQAGHGRAGSSQANAFGGDGGTAQGGGVYVVGSSLAIRNNSVIKLNEAIGGDSGYDNTASGYVEVAEGGGVYVSSATLSISDSRFEENFVRGGESGEEDTTTARPGGDANGGALFIGYNLDLETVTIESSLFIGNEATGGKGGGIRLQGTAARGGHARGGAIYNAAAILNVIDTEFGTNTAKGGAGGTTRLGAAGRGGDAFGGAIHSVQGAVVHISGTLEFDGTIDVHTSDLTGTTLTTSFIGNRVLGGTGGHKRKSFEGSSSDQAGDGGNVSGGAIYQAVGGSLEIDQVLFADNVAASGYGGMGNMNQAETCNTSEIPRLCVGSSAGEDGAALGGAIHSESDVALTDSSLFSNLAAGGGFEIDGRIAGGAGGITVNGAGYSGGDGGSASGGALSVYDASVTIAGSGFVANAAVGGAAGTGGIGLGLGATGPGGKGGAGGDATGGAIAVALVTDHEVDVTTSVLANNRVFAGAGGTAGFAAQDGIVAAGGRGGQGGQGGNASGGGLAIQYARDSSSLPTVDGTLSMTETIVSANAVVAGDGGAGGDGVYYSGHGGDGGGGGNAQGGGVYIQNVDATIESTTVDANVVSSGWGGRGGEGGSDLFLEIRANDFGGNGGNGGDGGLAAGGGIALDGGTLWLSESTIVNNIVISGGGGYGGHGERGYVKGGDAGHGGDGGDARGGGVYNVGNQTALLIGAATITGNSTNAGGGGFSGLFGVMDRNGNQAVEAYHRRDRPYIGTNGAAFPGSSTAILTTDAASVDSALLENPGLAGDTLTNSLIVGGVGAGAFVAGAGAAATGAVAISTIAFLGTASATFGGAAAAGSVGVIGVVAVSALPVLGIGAAAFTVAVVSAKIIISLSQGASFNTAVNDAFPDIDGSYGVNVGILFSSDPGDDDEHELLPRGPGSAGQKGDDGTSSGPGVFGGTHISRSLIAGNSARSRSYSNVVRNRTIHYDRDFIENGRATRIVTADHPSASSGTFQDVFEVTQTTTDLYLDDVEGGTIVSFGHNIIGFTDNEDSFHTNDQFALICDPGLSSNPCRSDFVTFRTQEVVTHPNGSIELVFYFRSAPEDYDINILEVVGLDTQLRMNGGNTPTLSLLPGSPASNQVPFDAANASQNGFVSPGNSDIGAWGGEQFTPVITGPVGPISVEPFSVLVSFDSEVERLDPNDLTITGGSLVSDIISLPNNEYRFAIGPEGAGIVTIEIAEQRLRDAFGALNLASDPFTILAVFPDETAPASHVDALPTVATSLTFDITISADDVMAPIEVDETVSGLAEIDLYVATDSGPFVLHQTLTGDARSISFTGVSNTQYWFRSIARDTAGNEESKPVVADTSIYVPDLDAPITSVNMITPTDTGWIVEIVGSEVGGSGLDQFTLQVSIDSQAATSHGPFDAGLPDPDGNHSVMIPYLGILDGEAHTYRFQSVGVDTRGNVEIAPASPDISISRTIAEPIELELIDVDIQNGSRQRSYIRHVDLLFNRSEGLTAVYESMLDADPDNDRLVLQWNSEGTITILDLTGQISQSSATLTVDFGSEGIGGDSRSADGNGTYQFFIDVDGDGEVDQTTVFHRLLGDANGDAIVDRIDMMDIIAGLVRRHDDADIDGDGKVDLADRGIVQREFNQEVATGATNALGELISSSVSAAIRPASLYPSMWQNASMAGDVNNDAVVSALDALIVVNQLRSRSFSNDRGTIAWGVSGESDLPVYLDANGDGRVTALDALSVINELRFPVPAISTDPIVVADAPDPDDERLHMIDHLYANEGFLF